jgi:hypothetical protein
MPAVHSHADCLILSPVVCARAAAWRCCTVTVAMSGASCCWTAGVRSAFSIVLEACVYCNAVCVVEPVGKAVFVDGAQACHVLSCRDTLMGPRMRVAVTSYCGHDDCYVLG